MEFYFTVFYSSLPFPLAEKAAESPMQATLTNAASYAPGNWLSLVRENNHNRQYIVTELSHYKERSAWPDCQHEYLILLVQLRPSPNQSSAPDGPGPFQLKISHTITGHSLPACLGLWGHAEDTIEVRGSAAAAAAIQDQQLHRLAWVPEDAPSLFTISFLINEIHFKIPRYFLLQTLYCAFALAIGHMIFRAFDGTAGTPPHLPFLIQESYLLHCIPSGIRRVELVAVKVANIYQHHHDDGK